MTSDQYQQAVGAELRALRQAHRMTRRKLHALLQPTISYQALAAYEDGVRHCSVSRFSEICHALNEKPHDVLARVEARVHPDNDYHDITVDLARIVKTTDPCLRPLRRWAANLLNIESDQVTLSPAAVNLLAELCAIHPSDLRHKLATLQ